MPIGHVCDETLLFQTYLNPESHDGYNVNKAKKDENKGKNV